MIKHIPYKKRSISFRINARVKLTKTYFPETNMSGLILINIESRVNQYLPSVIQLQQQPVRLHEVGVSDIKQHSLANDFSN